MSHCNQWELWCAMCSYVEVREPIELSFGVVSGVGPSIDVLDGVHVTQGEAAVSGFFGPLAQWFQCHIF